MGDRANVVVQESWAPEGQAPGEVFLYTHWGGSELPGILQTALKRNARWTDSSYLCRIIFQTMVGDDRGETGYGIGASRPDNEYPYLVVDCKEQEIRAERESDLPRTVLKKWSFEEFCNIDTDDFWSQFTDEERWG